MSLDLSEFYQTFFDEALEHLAEMESLLLALNIDAPDLDDLNAIFRAAHSIKGGSGMFGFNEMTEVTHILETLLDRLRKEELRPTEKMVDAFLQAADILKSQIDSRQRGVVLEQGPVDAICETLRQLASDESSVEEVPEPVSPEVHTELPPGGAVCQMQFSREGNALAQDVSFDWLLDSLKDLGDLEVIDRGEQPGHQVHLRLTNRKSRQEITEAFSFFLQPDQYVISDEGAGGQSETTAAHQPSGAESLLPEQTSLSEEDLGFGLFSESGAVPSTGAAVDASASRDQSKDKQDFGVFAEPQAAESPSVATAEQTPTQPPVVAPHAEAARQGSSQPPAPPVKKGVGEAPAAAEAKAEHKPSAHSDSSIRVNVEKVDQLINMVGELVITQAMLAQTTSELLTQTTSEVNPIQHEHLLNGIALLQRNTRDLQEAVMSIRMMPMSFVFSRFPRMVRDLAGKLRKEINFKTQGENTELDKGLIEKIVDPLTHLVRNSLDHGIEAPDARSAKGKDAKGNLILRAFHQGGNVVIEVEDDGAGLNRERILAKARERGLPVSDAMPDQDVWSLIMAPGFSTAEVVTDVSGRGVGMDVVKKNIEGLGGRVEIESATGVGTKMTIRLPLTLAILDGLSIAVGKETFIVPLTSIIESLQPKAEDVNTVGGEGWVVRVRGEYLPLIVLHQMFNIRSRIRRPEDGTLMIVEADGARVALLVDELLGQHQVVIKSLETNYQKVPGISGATIMGDGRVALILDITGLVRISKTTIFSERSDVPGDEDDRQTKESAPNRGESRPGMESGSQSEPAQGDISADEQATSLLENAVEAHTRWKTRLRMILDGKGEKLDSRVVGADDACDLGKWIYGDGAKNERLSSFRQLKVAHAHFHRCAADVIKKNDAGDRDGAEKLLGVGGGFAAASTETVMAIKALQAELAKIAAE